MIMMVFRILALYLRFTLSIMIWYVFEQQDAAEAAMEEQQQQQQLLDSQLANTTSSVLSDILQATGITDINVQDESTNSANEKGECNSLKWNFDWPAITKQGGPSSFFTNERSVFFISTQSRDVVDGVVGRNGGEQFLSMRSLICPPGKYFFT